MARDFATQFYKTQQWKKCRDLYAASVGGVCEVCWEKGIITAGEIGHHKIFLTPENIDDPNVTLNWKNLQLVCRDCHADIHKGLADRRYKIDELGRVIICTGYQPTENKPEYKGTTIKSDGNVAQRR